MKAEESKAMAENSCVGGGELGTLLRSHDWSQTPLGALETWSDDLKTAVQILLTELDRAKPPKKTQLDSDLLQDSSASAALHQANQLNAFRVKLADALRSLTDTSEIQAIAARILGESLGANRVIYTEVVSDGEEVIVHRNYTNGVAELSGRYRLEDYRRNLSQDHQAGQTQIVTDIPNNPSYTDAEKARYREIDIAAHIDVPLIKNNQFVGLLAVHQSMPRQWTETDVKLVEETAEQTWAAVVRARAEAALRESEEKYRTLFESIDEGYFIADVIFDSDDRPIDVFYLKANPAVKRLTGLDLAGRSLREIDPNYESHWWEALGRVAQTGIAERQELYAEPLESWFSFYAFKVGDANSRQVAVVFQDVTQRKQTEAALHEREQRLRIATEAAQLGVFEWQVPEDITIWENERLYEIYGLTPADGAISAQDFFENYLHPDDADALKAKLKQAMQTGFLRQTTYRIRRKDGTIRWIELNGQFELAADGSPLRFVGVYADISDRIEAENALRQSEERYRTLFESIDDGFCMIEMLFDAEDRPIDYRFLETNSSFEQQSGLVEVVGKRILELAPDREPYCFEIYGRVAKTGESVRFENYAVALDRWFDIYAYRIGQPEQRKVALLFKNISVAKRVEEERKRAAEISQRVAKLDAFRVSLNDALRPLADPVEVQVTASRVLGEYIGANRVAYFEVRDGDYVVERDYVNGADPIAGSYPIDSFGPKLLAEYRAGRTAFVCDVAADSCLSPEQKSAYAAIQIGAYIGIPLIKEGKFVAGLAVHTAGPRAWTPDEISLAQEVAERTWLAVERADAEAALRQSETRFRRIFECEMVPMAIYTKAGGIIEANNSLLNLIGYTRQELETGQISWQALTPPEYRSLDEIALNEIAVRGVSTPYEKVYIHKDGRRIPILIGAALFLEDASSGVLFAIDLSDRKQAEAALQEQSQLMQLILTNCDLHHKMAKKDTLCFTKLRAKLYFTNSYVSPSDCLNSLIE